MKINRLKYFFYLIILVVVLTAIPAFAAPDDDLQNIELFNGNTDDVVTSARSPRPASKVAENVSVITSEQIEALNAHTLAEVLNTVPGFQLQQVRTPGSVNFFFLDGAQNSHIQVLIDGVPQNDLSENLADFGLIPVQHVERVEIIKGAASAAWGQAMGGVINIITKSPACDKPISSSVTASAGRRSTDDLHGEVTGTVDRLGYYFSGGFLHSDGLLPHNGVNFRNVYGKFTYDLPTKGTITLGGDLRDAHRDSEEVPPPVDWRDSEIQKTYYYFLNINLPLADRLNLELLSRASRRDRETQYGFMSSDALFQNFQNREIVWGQSGKLTWGDSQNNLTTGVEYEHADARSLELIQQSPDANFDKGFSRVGVYANGAISYRALTLLPGARFDHTGSNGDLASYTFGATYRITDQTVLRGYWARGYSLPRVAYSRGPQKVWTTQGGIESSDVPYLWLKGTVFYNDTWNVESMTSSSGVSDQIRKGFELEARTVPVYNVSLSSGYTLADVRDSATGAPVDQIPKHVVKIGVFYDNKKQGLNSVLTGSYAKWTSIDLQNGKDGSFVWDWTLTKKIGSRENAPEVFFSGHNLFNNQQYLMEFFKNTGRWIEGGVRCKF